MPLFLWKLCSKKPFLQHFTAFFQNALDERFRAYMYLFHTAIDYHKPLRNSLYSHFWPGSHFRNLWGRSDFYLSLLYINLPITRKVEQILHWNFGNTVASAWSIKGWIQINKINGLDFDPCWQPNFILIFHRVIFAFYEKAWPTDGPTDGPMDGRTDPLLEKRGRI